MTKDNSYFSLESLEKIERKFRDAINSLSKEDKKKTLSTELHKIRMTIYKYLNFILPKFAQFNYSSDNFVVSKIKSLKREYAKERHIDKVEINISLRLGAFIVLYNVASSKVKNSFTKKLNSSLKGFFEFLKINVPKIVKVDSDEFNATYLDKGNTVLKSISSIINMNDTYTFSDKSILITLYIVTALIMTEFFLLIRISLLRAYGKL